MRVTFDTKFQSDFKQVSRALPHIKSEMRELIFAIEELGEVPEGYNPHLLVNSRSTYTGYWGLHLLEGRYDVIVVYTQHASESAIRFIRIGSHKEIFHGKEL